MSSHPNSLANGPNAQGDDLLAAAIAASRGSPSSRSSPSSASRRRSSALGGRLASVEPTSLPVDLNSFLLALAGSAYDVASAAAVLATGAVALLVARGVMIAAGRRTGAAVRATA